MKCFWKNKIYPTLMTCFLLAGQFTQTAAIAGEWDVQESQADTEGADYQNIIFDKRDSEQEISQDYVTEELDSLPGEYTSEPAFSQMIEDDCSESNGADVFNDEMPDAKTGDYVDSLRDQSMVLRQRSRPSKTGGTNWGQCLDQKKTDVTN